MNREIDAKDLAWLGMLAAAGVLATLFRFPLFPAVPFLEMEFADVFILFGTFLNGVPSGLALTVTISVLQGLLVSPISGVYGVIMHVLASGTLAAAAGLAFHFAKKRSADKEGKKKKTALNIAVALACGTLSMTVMMFFANMLVTPHFMGAPLEAVMSLMPWILLFNLCKAGINSAVVFVVYKYVTYLPLRS